MMTELPLVELSGFAAGGIVSVSAIPRIVSIWRDPSDALKESVARNAMLVLGNMIWIGYGIEKDLVALPLMCSVAALTNAYVLAAAVRVRLWAAAVIQD